MSFYSGLILLTVLLMLAMSFHVFNYSGFTEHQRTWYLLTFSAIILCSSAEFAVHCGYYDPFFSPVLTCMTVFQFSVAPLLGILFSGALGLEHQGIIAIVYFAINLVTEVTAAFHGWIFSFTEEGYVRGPGFLLYEFFYLVSLVYVIISLIIVGRKFRHRDFITILMIVTVLAAGIAPMILFRLNITYIAVALGASLCYIYYNDLVQQDIKDELIVKQNRISAMQDHIISGMASVIESRDMDTGGHISRTSAYVKTLAEHARRDGVYADVLDDHFISLVYTLAPMHDVGKVLVSDAILKKPGRLTNEEFEEMKQHATFGGKIVREILRGITDDEYISFASDIATYHHERWDGTGYPSGLKGEEIPLPARIMAIADVFDALTSERCYKKPFSRQKAFQIIREESGTHFDPMLATVFLNHREDFI